MNIIKQQPEIKYPYLAAMTLGGELNVKTLKDDDIFLISLVDGKPHVQPLFGGKSSWNAKSEKGDYTPLPAGYKIIIEQ